MKQLERTSGLLASALLVTFLTACGGGSSTPGASSELTAGQQDQVFNFAQSLGRPEKAAFAVGPGGSNDPTIQLLVQAFKNCSVSANSFLGAAGSTDVAPKTYEPQITVSGAQCPVTMNMSNYVERSGKMGSLFQTNNHTYAYHYAVTAPAVEALNDVTAFDLTGTTQATFVTNGPTIVENLNSNVSGTLVAKSVGKVSYSTIGKAHLEGLLTTDSFQITTCSGGITTTLKFPTFTAVIEWRCPPPGVIAAGASNTYLNDHLLTKADADRLQQIGGYIAKIGTEI